MKVDDPAALDVVRRSMVARIATLSRNGRPNINPLYFVCHDGHIWLGTAEWTLAARNVRADPRVSVLFEVERDRKIHRVLLIRGRASVRTDQKIERAYILRVVRKFYLSVGGIRDTLTHIRQLAIMRRYYAQSTEKGRACVIEVIPEQVELLDDGQPG